MKPVFIKLLTSFIFVSYLYLGLFTLLSLSEHNHHNPIDNCPFMIGSMVLCQMNIFEHITSWQYMSITLPIKFLYFILIITSLVLYKFWLIHLFDPPDNFYKLKFLYFTNTKKIVFLNFLLKSTITPRAP